MNKKIFIACDTTKISKVKKIIKHTQTKKLKIGYKFGVEFLNSKHGRLFISKIKNKIVFADLKLHDIPNTCVSTVKAIKDLRVNYKILVRFIEQILLVIMMMLQKDDL